MVAFYLRQIYAKITNKTEMLNNVNNVVQSVYTSRSIQTPKNILWYTKE